MKKKIGAFGAGQFSLGTLVGGRPGTTIFQNPGGGGGGGGGGLGGVAYKDRARPPPREWLVSHADVDAAAWGGWAACIAHTWSSERVGGWVGGVKCPGLGEGGEGDSGISSGVAYDI